MDPEDCHGPAVLHGSCAVSMQHQIGSYEMDFTIKLPRLAFIYLHLGIMLMLNFKLNMVSFLLLAPYGLVSHWFPCMAYVYNIDLSVFSLIFTIPLACKVRSYITGVAIATSIPQWNQYLILTLLLN